MKNLEESIQEKGPSKSCGRSCSLGWYCRKSLAKTQGGGGRGLGGGGELSYTGSCLWKGVSDLHTMLNMIFFQLDNRHEISLGI